MTDIIVSITISVLLRAKSFVERFVIILSTSIHIYNKITLFLISAIAFLSCL